MTTPAGDEEAVAEREPLTCHKGHKRYVGGIMDGQITHMTGTHPTDYPLAFGTVLRHGQRSWYELDHEASVGTDVVYRCIGHGKTFPQREITSD